jgi:hypothetical protein
MKLRALAVVLPGVSCRSGTCMRVTLPRYRDRRLPGSASPDTSFESEALTASSF